MSLGLLTIGLYGSFFASPADYQQGEAVRILYIHVPAAMMSLFVFTIIGGCSLIYLIWPIKMYDTLAKQAAPLGIIFTLIALLTGSLWGKPMWGTWWIWDARLTSELILLFLYAAYCLLDQSLGQSTQNAKACAVLGVVGMVDVPIIHYSVKWWHTLHQGSTLTLFSKPTIHGDMLKVLLVMILGFTTFFFWVWLTRVRADLSYRQNIGRY
jgi:heme exporter protein C